MGIEFSKVGLSIYKDLRSAISENSRNFRGGGETVLKDLVSEAENLEKSGDDFSARFVSGIAMTLHAHANARRKLVEGIDSLRNSEPGAEKTWLQAFLAVTIPDILLPSRMPEASAGWKNTFDQLLEQNNDFINPRYQDSDLAAFTPESFGHEVIGLMAESRGDDFEYWKKVAWVLTCKPSSPTPDTTR